MNMFLHELKAYRKSTIIWTCSLAALVVVFLSLYPAFSKDVETVKNLFKGFPEAVRKAFGFEMENFFSILGFYSFLFMYVTLCGSIQAMNLGTSIVSKEIREKTADFLLSKPVSRKEILTAKLLAAFTSLVVTNTIFLIIANTMTMAVKSEDYSIKIFLLISITLFSIQLFFLSLGVVVSVIFSKIKSVISVSLSTVFGFFIISMVGSIIGDEAVRYITPYKFYDNAYIMNNASYEPVFVIIEVVFIITAIAASYLIYAKKDIHTV